MSVNRLLIFMFFLLISTRFPTRMHYLIDHKKISRDVVEYVDEEFDYEDCYCEREGWCG